MVFRSEYADIQPLERPIHEAVLENAPDFHVRDQAEGNASVPDTLGSPVPEPGVTLTPAPVAYGLRPEERR